MSVTSTDIVIYASQNMPEDDTSTSGGSVNSGIRVVFDDIVATDTVEASGSVSDSGTLTVTGRNSAGSIVTDSIALSGTTRVTGTTSFERILKVESDAVASGTITVRDTSTDTQIGQIPANESGFRRPFYAAAANAGGGANKTLYEKVFVTNNNTGNALLGATIIEVSSGVYTDMTFGLEANAGSNQSVSNRETAPTGVAAYGNGPSGVPGTDISPSTQHGMWLKFDLSAGAAAQNSFYQFQVSGTTT